MATNPLVPQGTLNRVRCSIVVPSFTNLNITAPYMGKSFARLAFEGNYAELIGTATGAVTSPEPYVFATLTVGLLRTQALSAQWLAQAQQYSAIGQVSVHPDSAAFPAITLDNTVINQIDPGAYDGTDPVVRVVLRGVFYANSDLWNL
jgi:hypothetical protein